MLELSGLTKTFATDREDVQVLKGVDLAVEQGKLYTLLGPSGCGKSTILRCVAGLEQPTSGEIRIGGEIVYSSGLGVHVPVYKRQIGMVFQSYAIWPHMDVFHNVAFPLLHGLRTYSKDEIKRRVKTALSMVQLEHLHDRMAPLLSGGQQQRVALARALVYEPKLLLLDEPLSNLDAQLRAETRKEIRELVTRFNITTLFVTHDQAEALAISDRIAVLQGGVIIQEGTPADIYSRPRTSFVARFVGNANLIRGRVIETTDDGACRVQTSAGVLDGVPTTALAVDQDVDVAIRPGSAHLDAGAAADARNAIQGHISSSVFTGDHTEFQLHCGGENLEFKLLGLHALRTGQSLTVHVPADQCVVVPQGRDADGHVTPVNVDAAVPEAETSQR